MRKGVYSSIGFFVLLAALSLFFLPFFVDDATITGYVGFSGQTNFAICDANISCGFTGWSDGQTYCLNESQTSNDNTCFSDINADNVILDLQGFYIDDTSGPTGATSYGVLISGTNVTVRQGEVRNATYGVYVSSGNTAQIYNLTLNGNRYGVYLDSANNAQIYNLGVQDSVLTGIHFSGSDSNNVTDNVLSNNGNYGLYITNSDNNRFVNYSSTNDFIGFYLDASQGNLLANATSANNYMDLFMGSSFNCVNEFTNLTGTNNMPILVYNTTVNLRDWDTNFSSLILCNSDNSVLDNMTLDSSIRSNGFFFFGTDGLSVTDITVNNTYYGLYLSNVTTSTFNNTQASESFGDTVFVTYSSSNSFYNGTAFSSVDHGYTIRYSDGNYFENITARNNSDNGLYVFNSDSNTVVSSAFYNNTDEGIRFFSSDSNNVTHSTLSYNLNHGMSLASASSTNNMTNVSSDYNTLSGFSFSGASNSNSLYDSFARNNSQHGVYINDSDYTYMFNVTVENNTLDGVHYAEDSSDYNTFIRSFSHLNLRSGVNISEGSRFNTFITSNITNNSGDGLYLLDSWSNSFYDVLFMGNSLSAVNSTNASGSLFRNPAFRENTQASAFVSVNNHTFYYNVSDDIVRFDVTQDVTITDTLFNFSDDVTFGATWVDVNSSSLESAFNTSSQVTLDLSGNGITYPMPIVDGVLCSDCTAQSFSSGLFVFDVPHFTNYSVNDSTCGDSYCSVAESCSICEADCGVCSGNSSGGGGGGSGGGGGDTTNSSDSSSGSGSSSGGSGGSDTSTSSDTTQGETSEEKEDFFANLPWIWIIIIAASILFVLILTITILTFVRNNSEGGRVISARRPTVPIRSPVLESTSDNYTTKVSMGNQVRKQQAQQPMFQKPVMPQPTQKPAMQPQAQASKPHLSPSTGIASIKEYVNKQSNNPKVRIRYFLESGYMLLENKDQKNAQEIYKFIFEEYRNLEFHDEDLYRTIVSFRLGIR